MGSILKVEDLCKSFRSKQILRNISFSLGPGDILGIIGPNGAGKSTLLYILTGVITPDSGQILYFGKDFDHNRSEILQKVGFASHYVSLPFSLTVWENLKVFAYLYKVRDAERKINELLELFLLREKKHSMTRALSSGEMMRLNLVRALLPEPKILLLDEPTAGLDPDYVRYVGKILKEKSEKEGLTIILTSHQLGELERIITKILLLREGKVLDFGDLGDLLHKYKVTSLEDLYFKIFGHAYL